MKLLVTVTVFAVLSIINISLGITIGVLWSEELLEETRPSEQRDCFCLNLEKLTKDKYHV